MTIREMLHRKPWTLTFATICTLWPGPMALVCGEKVSTAFTKIGAGYLANVMGAVLVLGGLCTIIGMKRRSHMAETIGLVAMAMGCALYALGVMLGLGIGGMVAGPITLAAAIAMLLTAAGIVADARKVTDAVDAKTP